MNFARVEGGGQGMVEFADRNGLQFALDNKDELTLNGQRLQIRHITQSTQSVENDTVTLWGKFQSKGFVTISE